MSYMARNQGFQRLERGFHRKLTASEVLRGYLFITKDATVVDTDNLTIVVNGKPTAYRLDAFGRIGIGKAASRRASEGMVYFKLSGNRIYIICEAD
jgi:hypothetical protein